MSDDDPIDLRITQVAGALLAAEIRISELEHMVRHFDSASMTLLHYVRAVVGTPDQDEWLAVREMVEEMVDPYGPRNPYR